MNLSVVFSFLLLLIGCFNLASAQTAERQFIKEIGWTVTLPPDFKILSATDQITLDAKGKAAFEKETKAQIDISTARTLLSAKKDKLHYFSCVVAPYDAIKDGDWLISNEKTKRLLYNTFKNQLPNVKLDSVTTKVKIDGIPFNKFSLTLTTNNLCLKSYLYSKLYKGFDLGINCVFVDVKVGEMFQQMLDQSKFIQ